MKSRIIIAILLAVGSISIIAVYADTVTINTYPYVIQDSSGNQRLNIISSGNVGIGTTSPDINVRVQGASGPQIGVKDTTNNVDTRMQSLGASNVGIVGTYSNHDFVLYSNGAERMRITSGGNVGIGTTTPAQKLDVSGNIRLTGNLTSATANEFKITAPSGVPICIGTGC